MAFTDEQQAIIESPARVVRARAFAGAGKSTMLVGYAQARKQHRGLMVCFNKSIQMEMQHKLPPGVVAKTGHALAFRQFGAAYKDKLAADLKPLHVAGVTQRSTRAMPENVARIFNQRVIEGVKRFLVSADLEVAAHHVAVGGSPMENKWITAQAVIEEAGRVWGEMQSLRSPVPMLHDGYLKLWQLSRPVLPADFILFDEAQDTNPVMQAVIAAQPCSVVYVGDQHQCIYGFRGAANAMESIHCDEDFYLTGSFRFGPEVAEVANQILALKGETVALRGLAGASAIQHEPVIELRNGAFISRSNAAIFQKAVWARINKVPCAFVGGVGSYKFELGEDIARLHANGPSAVRNPVIASFKAFDELTEYAEAVSDIELMGWSRAVDAFGARRFMTEVERIRECALTFDGTPPPGGIVVVTAHRSKGMEFDMVELADNFIDPVDQDTLRLRDFSTASTQDQEEINLLYVAATRARKRLAINSSIRAVLDPPAVADGVTFRSHP